MMMLRQVAHDLETGFPIIRRGRCRPDPARRVHVGRLCAGPAGLVVGALYGPWPVGPDGSRSRSPCRPSFAVHRAAGEVAT